MLYIFFIYKCLSPKLAEGPTMKLVVFGGTGYIGRAAAGAGFILPWGSTAEREHSRCMKGSGCFCC